MNKVYAAMRLLLLICFLGAVLIGGASIRAQSNERKVVKKVEPYYPEVLRERNIGGTVRLKVLVKADGKVRNVEIEGGNPILAQSAVRAVKEWRFAPADHVSVNLIVIHFDPDK